MKTSGYISRGGYIKRPKVEPPTIQERFELFDSQHPEIRNLLVRLAREAKRSGMERYSMAALYEVARWRHIARRGRRFAAPNSFRSRYSRLIEETHRDLDGFFTKARLRNPQ